MIEFHGVSKVFAGHPAVKDLTLELREGAFSVLVGTSGSGKSTTLKMINRLLEPDRGMIRFAGEDIRQQPLLTLRRRMGYRVFLPWTRHDDTIGGIHGFPLRILFFSSSDAPVFS